MPRLSLDHAQLDDARRIVREHVAPTPARRWPLIEAAVGTEVWIKHENHNPTGAFKVRGGVVYAHRHRASGADGGIVSASRGNHSQSLAFAGAVFGVPVTIVVPEGNSPDKNAATASYGARVISRGRDFQSALEYAVELSEREALTLVPPLHPWLVEGIASYPAELHETVPEIDTIYVPVGMGSGICANILVRDLLSPHTEIVGVVADRAPAYAFSFTAGSPVATESADTFIDGVACRTPDPSAVATIVAGAQRIVRITEAQAASAMELMYRATHNLAEPAGALALAGALAERQHLSGKRVAVVHTGGNADFAVLAGAFASASSGA